MDEVEQKAKVKQLRGGIGLAIAAVWIGFWWMRLKDARLAARAACPDPEGLGVRAAVCLRRAEESFGIGLMLAVALTPLAFWAAHYIARALVNHGVDTQRRERQAAHREHQQKQEDALRQMGESAAQEATTAQRDNDRYELITRLGAVDDQLIVLESEQDADRQTRIRLTIAQALRELDAKFTDAQLRAMFDEHAPVRGRVNRTLSEMQRLDLGDTRQYADLAAMFGLGDAPEEEATSESPTALPVTG